MEVGDTVQETGIKTIPKKKKHKKPNWLSEEALQIAVKRREAKNKGEKERYTHLIGGGNGNPLQCPCLENPRDGERGRLVGCRLWGRTESDTIEVT